MRNVKKQLSDAQDKVLPDAQIKENIRHTMGYDAKPRRAAAPSGTFRRRRSVVMSILTAATLVACCVCIIVPLALFGGGGDGGGGDVNVPIDNKFNAIVDADSFYAYGAASVGAVIGSSLGTGFYSVMPSYSAKSDADELKNEIAELDKYMPIVDSLLGNGGVGCVDIGGAEIDGVRYGYGMKITATFLFDAATEYSLYYERTLTESENDDDEIEEEYSIEGVLVIGERKFRVQGSYSIEQEEDESESELYFRAYTGERSYIEVGVEEEYEDNEKEKKFVYSFYDGEKVVDELEIEYEGEGDEMELKLVSNACDLEFSRKKKDDKNIVYAHGEIGNKKTSFKVLFSDGDYEYIFADGSSL